MSYYNTYAPSGYIAALIYDILVAECGAYDDQSTRGQFNAVQGNKKSLCAEYRFGGKLGSGGKFWNNGQRFYVNCYSENETPERLAMIKAANQKLVVVHKLHMLEHKGAEA